ncbi:uncharacterized protein LOC123554584 isoform X2 [Mercenaria mercenaria]|uniref:uncharacterized protein LOC123554584 isoform X2 n=1 Tax=Mercenaria mercenaria TaxID=6596 RepID=UPI00234F411F|nr:uncharacterized protein LOC123554584 isoform X2 [Mercenaria mercenaria]
MRKRRNANKAQICWIKHFGNIVNECSSCVGVLKLPSATKTFFSSANVVRKRLLKRYHYSKKRRKFQVENVFVLIPFILLVITASLALFVTHVLNQEQESFFRKQITEFSVPCEDLSLSADEDFFTFDVRNGDLRTYVDDEGKYICSKRNIPETIKKVVERKARHQLAKGLDEQYLSCGNKTLAEKSGYLNVFFTEVSKHQKYLDESSDLKLQWNNHSGKYHIDPSVHYDDGEVTIPEGRTYFVYASVHFNISHQENIGIKKFARPQRISIRICKSVYGYERTLLGRTQLFNMTNTENVVSSLSIGSHLELSRDDTIYVRNIFEAKYISLAENFDIRA